MKKIKIVTAVLVVIAMLAAPIGTIFLSQNTIKNVYANESTLETTENVAEENASETTGTTTEEVPKEIEPNVKISVTEPFGWQRNGKAEVSITVHDILYTGKFEIAKVEARIGSNGSYTDITDTMSISVTENCSLYIQVTDSNGKVYTKTRVIGCFDKDKPSLNAGITSGMLTIQATDNSSGVKAVYVNGQEFTELTGNGTLAIKLQSFDASYEYFSIQAMDYAGNLSDVYKTKNPYYQDPEVSNTTEKVPTLPENVKPSGISDATASVLDYTNTATSNSGSEDKEKAGKEFYTIVTDNEKVFYLVIDNTQDSNNVYFLTEISENDLLNVTGTTYETLEPNSAVVESGLPKTESTVSKTENTEDEEKEENAEDSKKEPVEKENAEEQPAKQQNKTGTYIFYIVAAVVGVVVIYFLKFYRRKGENFEDDDESMDEYEEYDDEEYEKEEDFFETEDENEYEEAEETEEDFLEDSEDEEEE